MEKKYLKDYKKPAFLIKTTYLDIKLDEFETMVKAKLNVVRNSESELKPAILKLDGQELKLLSVAVDQKKLNPNDYKIGQDFLEIPLENAQQKSWVIEIENSINPKENLSCEGLYLSGSTFCTQNEPEGFRKITYYLDRSDVLSVFTTKISALKSKFPVLLSNGNLVESGDLPNGEHFKVWHDPFPKPSYLYALVAGDLALTASNFITKNKRNITLHLYCDKGNEHKTHFALESLKKAMKWDEDVFNLEYDLDIFMIVAVDAFNMGAMENKGLNIFNSSAVLADVKSTTDSQFAVVESIVAHEYFHNYTGNRVTVRDWFQLTLKEGLTVYRDQEFSYDIGQKFVKRIEDVKRMRDYQFIEDAGPQSHPIQPDSFIEINNFYTSTVYEKGSEVIRMISVILGKATFNEGVKYYLKKFDGTAATTEDFITSMEHVSGKNLAQFRNWYHQNGTPKLKIDSKWDESSKSFTLNIEQIILKDQKPFYIPLTYSLLGVEDKKYEDKVLIIDKFKEEFTFTNLKCRPYLSLNRNFYAPIIVDYNYTTAELEYLMKNETDPVNQWNITQEVLKNAIINLVNKGLNVDYLPLAGIEAILNNKTIDNFFKSSLLGMPNEVYFFENGYSFEKVWQAYDFLELHIAKNFKQNFLNIINELQKSESSDANRALKNRCYYYLSLLHDSEFENIFFKNMVSATNMTDEIAAFRLLCNTKNSELKNRAITDFEKKWSNDQLVMNMWLHVQATVESENVLDHICKLEKSKHLDMKIPNKLRALFGGLSSNSRTFHAADGSGYLYLAQKIIEIDKINPSVSSRLGNAFILFNKVDEKRKNKMKEACELILKEKVSKNLYEIISKTIGSTSV
ncbi:MAG: aminopeptidase N [Bacteriovoracaceae bacterium]